MASAIIHIAVAKEINKVLKRDETKLLIGSVAPDISKCVNETRLKSHFLNNENTDIPNIEKFLSIYKDKLNDDFVMGYFIHLYTDYFWFKYFITEIINDDNVIIKLNGDKIKLNGEMKVLYIYNDYTNINIELIKKYDIDLEKLYEIDIDEIPNIVAEIPYNKLEVLFESIHKIIKNTKENKAFIFDIKNVENFINNTSNLILSEIENLE